MSNGWGETPTFELPEKLERFLAILSRRYKNEGREALLRVVVNAKPEINVGAEYDNWNGGQYGHGVRLQVPELLFHEVMETRYDLEKELCKDLNRLADVPNESFAEVVFTLAEEPVPADWREMSGALLVSRPSLAASSPPEENRLWGSNRPRVFLSHRAEEKRMATGLKTEIENLGASAFVAHEDIEPTKEWQTEIERALGTMDVLVAMVTEGFHASHWANQEIGVAIGRGIPVISIRLGEDPAGFIAKHQALPGDPKNLNRTASALLARMLENLGLERLILPALLTRWEQVDGFSKANQIMAVLMALSSVPEGVLVRLEKAYQANDQLHRSAFVNREFPVFIGRMRAGAATAGSERAGTTSKRGKG